MVQYDNVLYIIGNGFDLHHGVHSSYRDFADWLKKNNRDLYGALLRVCQVEFLWKDFEKALAYVSRDYFIQMGELWLPENWTEDDSIAELYYAEDVVRSEANGLWDDIVKWFRKWVNTITWSGDSDQKKLGIDYDARFITFNYTPFLGTHYGVPKENILYIHGKAIDYQNPPIIGHDGDDTFDDWFKSAGKDVKKFYKGQDAMLPEVEMMTSSVEEFFSLSEKPVRSIIRKHHDFIANLYDVRYIYVLGHSLGKVDIPYFKAVNSANEHPEELVWFVSYYSSKEKQTHEKVMRREVINPNAKLEMIKMDRLAL